MKFFFITLILVFSITLRAQSINADSDFIEQLSANEESMQNNSEAAENFSEYIRNPIDINKIDEATLLNLSFLDEQQIKEILHYIFQYGPVINIYELQVLPAINHETFQRIRSCFSVTESISKNHLLKNFVGSDRSMMLMTYTPGHKDSPKNWTGNSDKLSVRFQSSLSNQLRVAFSMKKDAGEPIYWKPSKSYYGFDSWNGYVQYSSSKKWKYIIVGTYKQQFGQGLLIGGGFYAGKGAETITTLRKAGCLTLPIGSTTEYGRLAGFTGTYQLSKHIRITGFISETKEDASLHYNQSGPYITSISQTGYHRTLTELSSRKKILVGLYGYHIRYSNKFLSIGNTFAYRSVSYNIQPDPTYYNQFYNRGKNFEGTSIDFQWHYQNTVFFGEAAFTQTNGKALLAGALIALSSKADLSFLYRNYSREYNSPYAQAFGENSSVTNENGTYIGIKIRPKKQWNIHAYGDLFVFPWLKYRIHIPSNGEEYFFRIEYKPSKKTTLYFQFRNEQKSLDISNSSLTLPSKKQTNILYLEHVFSLSLTLRTRIQWSIYDNTMSRYQGYLFAQDLIFRKRSYQIILRWMWHDVEDYNARLYAYEPDLPYNFYIPAYNGKAFHPIVIFRLKLFKGMDAWIKYSLTKPMINSSTDIKTFSSKSISDWRLQLRWIF